MAVTTLLAASNLVAAGLRWWWWWWWAAKDLVHDEVVVEPLGAGPAARPDRCIRLEMRHRQQVADGAGLFEPYEGGRGQVGRGH